METFVYSFLVDIFGDVPFSEALAGVTTPVYDDAATIYNSIIANLDGAIANLGTQSNMGADIVYGGDSDAWKMFANSLKLKLAIRLADTDSGKAKSMAEAAVAGGVFGASADDFKLDYYGSTPNTNPLWEQLIESGRSDFVAANTFADILNPLNDPRIPFFFNNNDPETGGRNDLFFK